MGIAPPPHRLIAADIEMKRLERVLPQVNCGEIPVVVLYPHHRLLEPRVRHFIDLMVEELR
ncbi:MAG: hypothetical protein JKY31_05820 [Rhodobacteraceae bacterium]|nr:hypothetical protein [Paracoccaceae bacterium]